MRFLLFIFLLLFFSNQCFGQNKYWVFLKDKAETTFDPYTYFDIKAIERKLKADIPIDSYSDYPLNQYYVEEIGQLVDSVKGSSRWMNAVIIYASQIQLEQISVLSFVKSVWKIEGHFYPTSGIEEPISDFKKILHGQTETMGHPLFKDEEYEGENIRIAIFDVGFKGLDKSDELKHIFENNQIVSSYDFIRKEKLQYNKGGNHGLMVMSCIAGIFKEKNMGLAPNAEFLLARTERMITEFRSEEENWVLAAEWADKNGADIINSSLGYTAERYFQHDMDGETSIISKTANMAVAKGMLVVNSAGNSGDSYWRTIAAPADADSVLTVGGIDPLLGYHSSWSSYGPTADKRLKPNVSAYGKTIVSTGSEAISAIGTSFSAPLVTGFAACAWQAYPEYSAMELFQAIEESANLYPYYDYVHGYGIPQSAYFLGLPQLVQEKSFDIVVLDNILSVVLKMDSLSKIEITDSLTENIIMENDLLSSSESDVAILGFPIIDYVYIHIKDSDGFLTNYQVIKPEGILGGNINLDKLDGKTITIFYKGFIDNFDVIKK